MTINKRGIVTAHRWLGLAAAAFWLVQLVTGTLIVFHWEMRDAMLSNVDRPLDPAGIERRLDVLAPPGGKAAIGSMWTTAGFPNRFDIYFTDAAGADQSARIAGDGTVLRAPDVPEGVFFETLVGLHHDLLAGPTGDWIVAISGLLLVTNLIAGLVVAWPRRGSWRIALKPLRKGAAAARLYSWHRAAGLWLIVPALLIAATGTLLKFPDALAGLPGAEKPALPPVAPAGKPVGFAVAVNVALRTLPGSRLTSVKFPTADDATYSVRLQTPDEIRSAYGGSIVLVDADDGALRGSYPITKAPPAARFANSIVPIHTAQFAGPIGRIILFIIGLGLNAMIVFGLLLWVRRRKKRKTA